jgi:hydroxyethylthiazole kinase-like sugar kinase family protein
MPIQEQRRLKRGHVEGVLQRIGGFEAPVVLDAVGTAEVSERKREIKRVHRYREFGYSKK